MRRIDVPRYLQLQGIHSERELEVLFNVVDGQPVADVMSDVEHCASGQFFYLTAHVLTSAECHMVWGVLLRHIVHLLPDPSLPYAMDDPGWQASADKHAAYAWYQWHKWCVNTRWPRSLQQLLVCLATSVRRAAMAEAYGVGPREANPTDVEYAAASAVEITLLECLADLFGVGRQLAPRAAIESAKRRYAVARRAQRHTMSQRLGAMSDKPIPTTPGQYEIELASGEHHYALLDESGSWFFAYAPQDRTSAEVAAKYAGCGFEMKSQPVPGETREPLFPKRDEPLVHLPTAFVRALAESQAERDALEAECNRLRGATGRTSAPVDQAEGCKTAAYEQTTIWSFDAHGQRWWLSQAGDHAKVWQERDAPVILEASGRAWRMVYGHTTSVNEQYGEGAAVAIEQYLEEHGVPWERKA